MTDRLPPASPNYALPTVPAAAAVALRRRFIIAPDRPSPVRGACFLFNHTVFRKKSQQRRGEARRRLNVKEL